MTAGQERPARRHAPPTAVPSRRATPPGPLDPSGASGRPEPASPSYAPRVRPRSSLRSVVLVGVVLVVLSLLLGALGEVSWPWENGSLNGLSGQLAQQLRLPT